VAGDGNKSVENTSPNYDTYTLSIHVRRTHRAASWSPPRVSLAVQEISSSLTEVVGGSIKWPASNEVSALFCSGKLRGTKVDGCFTENIVCSVGVFRKYWVASGSSSSSIGDELFNRDEKICPHRV
jgi:hypothetical protein